MLYQGFVIKTKPCYDGGYKFYLERDGQRSPLSKQTFTFKSGADIGARKAIQEYGDRLLQRMA